MTHLQAGRWRLFVLALLAALFAGPVAATAVEHPTPVAVFDYELYNVSLEGETKGATPAEQKRLRLISDLLRRQLAESGVFVIVGGGHQGRRASLRVQWL